MPFAYSGRRAVAVATVIAAGCGSTDPMPAATPDLAMYVDPCPTQSMALPMLTGDAADALAMATPVIRALQGDAGLQSIAGAPTDTTGQTSSGLGQWIVEFYSPTTKHLYNAVFSSDVGHAGCEQIKARRNDVYPSPKQKSADVVAAAWTAMNVNPDPQKTTANVQFGYVSIGMMQPHSGAWRVAVMGNESYAVVLDDNLKVLDCLKKGGPCN